jgi:hypothetical protein
MKALSLNYPKKSEDDEKLELLNSTYEKVQSE